MCVVVRCEHIPKDNYGEFMKGETAESLTEVKWSQNILDRLANDKTCRGEILRDAKKFGDSLSEMQDRCDAMLLCCAIVNVGT